MIQTCTYLKVYKIALSALQCYIYSFPLTIVGEVSLIILSILQNAKQTKLLHSYKVFQTSANILSSCLSKMFNRYMSQSEFLRIKMLKLHPSLK